MGGDVASVIHTARLNSLMKGQPLESVAIAAVSGLLETSKWVMACEGISLNLFS